MSLTLQEYSPFYAIERVQSFSKTFYFYNLLCHFYNANLFFLLKISSHRPRITYHHHCFGVSHCSGLFRALFRDRIARVLSRQHAVPLPARDRSPAAWQTRARRARVRRWLCAYPPSLLGLLPGRRGIPSAQPIVPAPAAVYRACAVSAVSFWKVSRLSGNPWSLRDRALPAAWPCPRRVHAV